jgi:hypothetical protein
VVVWAHGRALSELSNILGVPRTASARPCSSSASDVVKFQVSGVRMKASPNNMRKLEPFTTGLPVPFTARYSHEEYVRLREGLIPKAMEDKWFIYFDEPHLFLHRSWTGQPVYRVKLAGDSNGAIVTEALCVADVIAGAGAQYQAELLDFLIGNLLLGKTKPFPMPPAVVEPAHGVVQHAVSGTRYRQTLPNRRSTLARILLRFLGR